MQAVGGLSLTAGDVEQEILHPTLVENPQHLKCVWNITCQICQCMIVIES